LKKLDIKLLQTNIDSIAHYDLSNNKVFGSAYWVFQENELTYEKYYGNLSADNSPVKEDTLFRLASMTKPITAIAILILLERGALSLTDPVSKYLPEFKDIRIKGFDSSDNIVDLGKPEKEVKIINLLTHTSGVGSNPTKLDKMTSEDKKTIDNSVKYHINMGLDFEPDSAQQYSGTGAFDVLVKIIEMLSKEDYLSFLKREIFEPCGMKDTTFIPSSEQWSRMISMHHKVNGENVIGQTYENCVFRDFPCTHFLGGAGLVSTLKDYALFAKMLLKKGKTETKNVISEETLKLMHTPYARKEIMPGKERWGLGVRVITDDSYGALPKGTFGWSGAFGSHFWIDYTNKIAAVFMKNSLFDGGSANESARNFEKAVNDSLV